MAAMDTMGLKRTLSQTASNQGREGTCALHMLSRLFVNNIFKLGGMLSEECNDVLNTETFLTRDISLKEFMDRCGDNSIKAIMFLYVYYVSLELYPDIICTGTKLAQLYKIVPFVTAKINESYCPEKLAKYRELIIPFLHTFRGVKTVLSHEFLSYGWFTKKFMQTIDHSYVGCGFGEDRSVLGHAVVIAGVEIQPTNTVIIIKNSWGKSNTLLSYKEFFEADYDWYHDTETKERLFMVPNKFVYLCTKDDLIEQLKRLTDAQEIADAVKEYKLEDEDLVRIIRHVVQGNKEDALSLKGDVIELLSQPHHVDETMEILDKQSYFCKQISRNIRTIKDFKELIFNYGLTEDHVNLIAKLLSKRFKSNVSDILAQLKGGKTKRRKMRKTKKIK